MENIFFKIHTGQFINGSLDRIKSILFDLYGSDMGLTNYNYLVNACKKYLNLLSDEELERLKRFNPKTPYDHLKGKIFAISYPDNVYTNDEYTLKTLGKTLEKYFPGINGIHILPEREMSHNDVWPQDFFSLLGAENSLSLVNFLRETGIIDDNRMLTSEYGQKRGKGIKSLIESWLAEMGSDDPGISESVNTLLESAYNSHFNDGGFSQKTRARIDPRFGSLKDLKKLSGKYSLMLDYVVNHLDIDNTYLEEFRKGNNNGEAFIIVTPGEYEELKASGELSKTFRPRPFPLFTGVRKYPKEISPGLLEKADKINALFTSSKLPALDRRVILFLSIYFKVRNDQGLTAEDKRILDNFTEYLSENRIEGDRIFTKSALQPAGLMLVPEIAGGLPSLIKALNLKEDYGKIFAKYDDEVFGEKFFVYTTFSESQADINPLSHEGFKMIVDDLFHLLSSGRLSMMRMDAIKYLWKEKGKKNFDMEEGNKLIEVITRVMQLTAPGVLPLDEVNSPDPIVYEMEKDGGFAYLFGQVNSTVAAFNEETIKPLKHFYTLFKEKHPHDFVSFIMLSTHDGRSVQGLGVQRTDGHVSVEQFYHLKEILEAQGGKAKFRSVPKGRIARDTFDKVVKEAALQSFKKELLALFTPESVSDKSSELVLSEIPRDKGTLLGKIAEICGKSPGELSSLPAMDYFLDWIVEGKTIYELCATSRSSFKREVSVKENGETKTLPVSGEMEAKRFALAQCFVLTFGQAVPAIYFNDLLGLTNDEKAYKLSGKPRDLNRRKSFFPNLQLDNSSDPFTKEYLPLINKIITARSQDPAFYPGSENFEFVALTDHVFVNHPYYGGNHTLVVGNISPFEREVKIELPLFKGFSLGGFSEKGKLMESKTPEGEIQGSKDRDSRDANPENSKSSVFFKDILSGRQYTLGFDNPLELKIEPFGIIWLSS